MKDPNSIPNAATQATPPQTPVRERRPFVTPSVQKIGGLKDLTQEFGGTGG